MATKRWDKECDIAIVGYGGAGAVAAITAYDSGAKVLLLEKSEHPGGNTVLAGGAYRFVTDVEKAIKYLTRLSGGRVSDEMIRAFAEGLSHNLEFAQELAKADGAELRCMKVGSVYPYEGGEGLGDFFLVTHVPGFSGFPWLKGTYHNGISFFKMLLDNVEKRGIEAIFSTPGRRLLRDEKGAVIGLTAHSQGKELAIKARKAVILACGGFEQNEWLKLQSLQGVPFYSMAPLTHTGDGVLMAQEMGAALWHMWHVHGSYGFKFPDYPLAFRHVFSGRRKAKRRMVWIVVDRLGRRYMNEYPGAPQDISHRPMELFDPDLAGYPRIPSYMIFDEEGRRLGPIAQPMGLAEHVCDWSQDNSKEVEKGWIVKDDTIAGLAKKLKALEGKDGLMDGKTLEETVKQWNQRVKAGHDPLGRITRIAMPIENPPYYGVPVWPIISNTQGGPVHNSRQQVLDAFLNPIPRLYAVGELGSFFGHVYELGGNLAEVISSGRIAGSAAAAESPW